MGGSLIYASRINQDDSVTTLTFPDQVGEPEPIEPHALVGYAKTHTMSSVAVKAAGGILGLDLFGTKSTMLAVLQDERKSRPISSEVLVGALAEGIYGPRIADLRDHLPEAVRAPFAVPR